MCMYVCRLYKILTKERLEEERRKEHRETQRELTEKTKWDKMEGHRT